MRSTIHTFYNRWTCHSFFQQEHPSRAVKTTTALLLPWRTHHILSNFLGKGRNKSRKSFQRWTRRPLATTTTTNRRLLDYLVQSLLEGFRTRLVHVPQGRIGSHRKSLKRLAIGQSLDENFIGQVIHQSLNELTAHCARSCVRIFE